MPEVKNIVVTGATGGIGYAAALALAKLGHRIIFNYRDVKKAETLINKICEIPGAPVPAAYFCDLSSFESIKRFSEFVSNRSKIDVLINNAGVWEMEPKPTIDDIEGNLAVNHLAPFLLTALLLPVLKKSGKARIVNVSSLAHLYGSMDFEDIEGKKRFEGLKSYRQSKLANILFTYSLAHKLAGSGITANCLEPGVVDTGLFDKMNSDLRENIKSRAVSVEEGASTLIYLADSEKVSDISGKYFHKEEMITSSTESYNVQVGERLWQISEEYVKDYLPTPAYGWEN